MARPGRSWTSAMRNEFVLLFQHQFLEQHVQGFVASWQAEVKGRNRMASFVPITTSEWKVASASLGPPVQSCRLRPGTLVSGPLLPRCKPIQAVHCHCPKEGHNDVFRLHRSGPLQHFFSLRPGHSNWWPGKIGSFTANLSNGFATWVPKAEDGRYTSGSRTPSRRRLILYSDDWKEKRWGFTTRRDPTPEEIKNILLECGSPGWNPQVCCWSTKGYEPDKKLRLDKVEFESDGFDFDFPKIRKLLEDETRIHPRLDIRTIMVIGACEKKQFVNALQKLTGPLTEKTLKDLDKRPYVARLQTKKSEPDNYWQNDKSFDAEAWELVQLDKVDEPSEPLSRKRKTRDFEKK